jgi:hypothetical protein
MFRPFTRSSSGLYKNQKVYYIFFKFCVPNRIPCGLQSCTQLVQGGTKRCKIECHNTQHISCPVCPMFLVESGVWIWRTCERWLIIDGIIMAPAGRGHFVAPCTSCVQLCKPHGIPFGTQNLKKCNTLSGFYIGLMMTQ